MEELSEGDLKKLSVPVHPLLEQIFISTRLRQCAKHKQWIATSMKIASKIPDSLAMCKVQFIGDIDMLLRCMEEEELLVLSKKEKEPIFGLNIQTSFSEMWVCGVYEICRALIQRKTAPDTEEFRKLFHILEGIRVTLDKFEIAKDEKNNLKCDFAPLKQDGSMDLEKAQTYAHDNILKAHIMPTGISQRTGAMLWIVTHADDKQPLEGERQTLSDAFLNLF
ncbi:MAG: hypothetical protein WC464_02205 [Bdellovibrionales bacterium]